MYLYPPHGTMLNTTVICEHRRQHKKGALIRKAALGKMQYVKCMFHLSRSIHFSRFLFVLSPSVLIFFSSVHLDCRKEKRRKGREREHRRDKGQLWNTINKASESIMCKRVERTKRSSTREHVTTINIQTKPSTRTIGILY